VSRLPLPFYFLRHGETDWNRDGRVMGRSDVPLNARGRDQAAHAARRLASVGIGSIWCSPLGRCRETAAAVAAGLALPVTVIDGLAERGWGAYEGRSRDVRAGRALGAGGVEPWRDFAARTLAGIAAIAGDPPPLVIAHSGTYRVLLAALGRPAGEAGAQHGCPIAFDTDGRAAPLD